MEDDFLKYFKTKDIILKGGSLNELTISTGEIIAQLYQDIAQLYAGLLEFQFRQMAASYSMIKIICNKLDNLYGIKIDVEAVFKESSKEIKESWPGIKKEFMNELEFWKLMEKNFGEQK